MLFDGFGHGMLDESARQDSVAMETWDLHALQHSKFINHNGAKMVAVWNVNKLTEARTKLEVTKLRTKSRAMINRCHLTKWGRM